MFVADLTDRQKPKINLAMLPDLLEAFKETTGRYGERRKWQVCSAAAYLWLRLSAEEQDELARMMWNADGDPRVLAQVLANIKKGPVEKVVMSINGKPVENTPPTTKPAAVPSDNRKVRRPK